MTKKQQRVHPYYLNQLIPISQLTADNILDLMNNTYMETLPRGEVLFNKGDTDGRTFYLIAGELELDDGNGTIREIQEGTQPAHYPLDNNQPKKVTAKAKTPLKFFSIDNDYLDILLTWNQTAILAVSAFTTSGDSEHLIADDNDWMSNILRSKIFHRIPPGNIQTMIGKMIPLDYKEGDTIIEEGDEGDYYYYINKGRCSVSRVMDEGGEPTVLAQLAAGSSFGEEALISGAKRNATIKMLSDGELICLAKDDFDQLLKAPVVKAVNYSEAEQMIHDGAMWLDVRLESEYENDGLPQSINIPLAQLRNEMASLAHDKKYIIYCGTGRRSASAAFLLSETDVDAYVLEGGLMNLHQDDSVN